MDGNRKVTEKDLGVMLAVEFYYERERGQEFPRSLSSFMIKTFSLVSYTCRGDGGLPIAWKS